HDATRNLPDAQDLAQNVFVRAYEKLERLRNPNRFGKWLVGIARLRCREWWRETSRHKEDRAEPGRSESAICDASDDDRIERLRKAITLLPEKERLALHAFYLQGKSADNARRITGLSRSGFYRLLERARKRLEQSLLQQ
ncbi:MAG: RNA polymerase sigma factor, partial [Planctomycetota bacterium]